MAAQQTLNGAQNHGSFHLQVERDCRPNHQPIQKIVSPLDPQYDANQHHSQSHAYDGPQKRSTGGDDGKVHKRYKSSPHETNAHPTNALLMLAEATSDVQNANEHTTYYPATFLMAAQESSVAAAESSDEADSDWNANYELLEAFHAKYGHVVVPEGWKDNPELYQWAELQRQEGWKRLCGQPELSSLTDQQMMKLHRLGFAWTAPETWDDMLAKVQAFYRKKGHANVPKRYKDDPKLAAFVEKQREYYAQHLEGLETPLTDARIEALVQMGFTFEVKQSIHETWDGMFDKLLAYFAAHGHSNVPDKSKDEPKLGRWVRCQRHHFKLLKEGKYSPLTLARLEKLNSIKFQWSVKETWMDMYQKLESFRSRHGHCNVPQKWKDDPKLGIFVHHQRRFLKLKQAGKYSTLTDERIELLNRIDFSWESPDKNPYLLQL